MLSRNQEKLQQTQPDRRHLWGNKEMTDQDGGLQAVAHTAQTEQPDLTQGAAH